MNDKPNAAFLAEDYFEDYYLKIKSASEDLLIKRKNKQAALNAYYFYKKQGKEVSWEGKWAGNTFVDKEIPLA